MALQLSRKLACGDKKRGETRRFNSRHLDCWKLRHRRNLWQRREIAAKSHPPEEALNDFRSLRFLLDDFRTVSQTIAAIPQARSTPPRRGIENTTPATPSTRSHNPVVAGLMDRLGRSTRSLF